MCGTEFCVCYFICALVCVSVLLYSFFIVLLSQCFSILIFVFQFLLCVSLFCVLVC